MSSPQIIFYISFAIFGIAVIYLLVKILKDKDTNSDFIKDTIQQKVDDRVDRAQNTLVNLADQKFKGHLDVLNPQIEGLNKGISTITTKLGEITSTHTHLKDGVTNLNNSYQKWNEAMANPKIRGDLGEEALQGILSSSGLKEGENYKVQEYIERDGKTVKPDFIISLPNKGELVIDSKFPYDNFNKAVEEDNQERKEEFYKGHAKAVLSHVKELSKKDYFSYLDSSPEYTVMYLNHFIFYHEAVNRIPDLVEQARQLNVIIATPEIIIALLSSITVQWKEHKMLSEVGKVTNEITEMHSRLKTFINHIAGIPKNLIKTAESVDAAMGSFNKNLIPQIKKIEELTLQEDPIDKLEDDTSSKIKK